MKAFWKKKLATTRRKPTAREVCHTLVAEEENNKEGGVRVVTRKGTWVGGAEVNVDVRLNVIAQRIKRGYKGTKRVSRVRGILSETIY